MIEALLVAGAAGGAGVATAALIWRLGGAALARAPRFIRRAGAVARPQMARWEAYIESRREALGRIGRLGPVALGAGLAALVVFAGGAILAGLRNPVGAVAAVATVALMPEWLYQRLRERRRERLLAALPAAAQALAAHLADSPNLVRALEETARQVPEPLSGCLARAARRLELMHDTEAAAEALARDLDSDRGRVFARLLPALWREPAMRRVLPRLAARLGARRALARKAVALGAMERTTALMLNLAAPVVFILSWLFIPDTPRYLADTVPGRVVVAAWSLSVVGGLWLDGALRRVD